MSVQPQIIIQVTEKNLLGGKRNLVRDKTQNKTLSLFNPLSCLCIYGRKKANPKRHKIRNFSPQLQCSILRLLSLHRNLSTSSHNFSSQIRQHISERYINKNKCCQKRTRRKINSSVFLLKLQIKTR